MIAIVERVFFERGIRFIFSTRAKVPYILKPDGSRFFEGDYKFEPGKDETILEGKAGYVVSFGEMLYRSYDAVLRVREQGLDVGLINKSTLNLVDEEVRIQFLRKSADCLYLYQTIKKIGSSPFVLVVESLNKKTGVSFFLSIFIEMSLTGYFQLGSKYGTWLLERNLTPKYGYLGTTKEGCGGLWEQIPYQGLDPDCKSCLMDIATLY